VVSHEVRHYEERLYFPKSESEKHYSNFAEWEACGAPQDTGNRGLAEGWAAGDFYDGAWQLMSLPNRWQDQGHAANGVLWFRHVLTIPSAWFGEDLELHLGAVDKHDDTWVNGVWAGGLSWEAGPNTWLTQRVYSIPAHLVDKEGRVCISVRVRSHVFHGGLTGPVGEMYLTPLGAPESERLSLAGAWRYAVEQNWGVVLPPGIMWGTGGEHNANSLAILYESRIAPLVPYGIRGVLWYQGESNASEADEYRRLLPSMIRDWRRAWGQGDFPFLQVQLANFKSPVSNHCRSEWAELRDAQAAALSEPKVGMAVAIDVGDALDIHPRDKRSVGLRLAQWALAEAYGREGLPSGPIYAGSTAEAGGRIRIRFRHGQGLRTRDGLPPSHVAIARQNRTFEWAQSMIEGETLVVWHPEISFPMAVRYAWADNPEGCNLINVAGLPAAPFRTDSWQS